MERNIIIKKNSLQFFSIDFDFDQQTSFPKLPPEHAFTPLERVSAETFLHQLPLSIDVPFLILRQKSNLHLDEKEYFLIKVEYDSQPFDLNSITDAYDLAIFMQPPWRWFHQIRTIFCVKKNLWPPRWILLNRFVINTVTTRNYASKYSSNVRSISAWRIKRSNDFV